MTGERRFGAAIETAGVLVLALVAIYAALLPASLAPERLPVPDLVYCLTLAWVIRRPAAAPLAAVLALGLMGDALLSRPLGLGALGLLVASEAARRNARLLWSGPFAAEWIAVGFGFALMMLGMHLVLKLAFVGGPGLADLLRYAAVTGLTYPLAVAALNLALGVRSPRRGPQTHRLGRLR